MIQKVCRSFRQMGKAVHSAQALMNFSKGGRGREGRAGGDGGQRGHAAAVSSSSHLHFPHSQLAESTGDADVRIGSGISVLQESRSGTATSTCSTPYANDNTPNARDLSMGCRKQSANASQKYILNQHYLAGQAKRSPEDYEAIARSVSGLNGGKIFNYKSVENWFTNRRNRGPPIFKAKFRIGTGIRTSDGGVGGGEGGKNGECRGSLDIGVSASHGRVLRSPEERFLSRSALLSLQVLSVFACNFGTFSLI